MLTLIGVNIFQGGGGRSNPLNPPPLPATGKLSIDALMKIKGVSYIL